MSSNRGGDVTAAHAQDRCVEEHVVAAGQLGVETGAELEQRRHPACGRCTRPGVGWRMPAMHFSRVDLPEPFWPITPKTSPSLTSNVTSFRAVNSS